MFAVVPPATDAEVSFGRAVRSWEEKDQRTIAMVVVGDRCTDGTVAAVTEWGSRSFETGQGQGGPACNDDIEAPNPGKVAFLGTDDSRLFTHLSRLDKLHARTPDLAGTSNASPGSPACGDVRQLNRLSTRFADASATLDDGDDIWQLEAPHPFGNLMALTVDRRRSLDIVDPVPMLLRQHDPEPQLRRRRTSCCGWSVKVSCGRLVADRSSISLNVASRRLFTLIASTLNISSSYNLRFAADASSAARRAASAAARGSCSRLVGETLNEACPHLPLRDLLAFSLADGHPPLAQSFNYLRLAWVLDAQSQKAYRPGDMS